MTEVTTTLEIWLRYAGHRVLHDGPFLASHCAGFSAARLFFLDDPVQNLGDLLFEGVRRHRLHDIGGRARLQRLDHVPLVGFRGDHDEGDVVEGALLAVFLHQGIAALAGQNPVHKHDVEMAGFQLFLRLMVIADGVDMLEPHIAQVLLEHLADNLVIVDNQRHKF